MAIVVLGSEPAGHDVWVDVVDGPEFIISGEAGVELDGEMMSRWKEEDGGDMGNVMLMKDVVNCDTFGCISKGVFGIWEGGNGIHDDSIIIFGCDDFTSRHKISAYWAMGIRVWLVLTS